MHPAAPQTLPFPRGGILWRLVNYSNFQIAVVELTSLERVKIFSLIEHLLPLIQSLFKGSFCCCCCYVPGFRYRHVLAVPRRPSPALPTAPSHKTRGEERPPASSVAFPPRAGVAPGVLGHEPLAGRYPHPLHPKGAPQTADRAGGGTPGDPLAESQHHGDPPGLSRSQAPPHTLCPQGEAGGGRQRGPFPPPQHGPIWTRVKIHHQILSRGCTA